MTHIDPDAFVQLNSAVQQVKRAARTFPNHTQNLALKAAGQVILDAVVGIEYRVWSDDEPTSRTLQMHARDFAEVAEQLSIAEVDGDAIVVQTLADLVRQLTVPTSDGIDAPF